MKNAELIHAWADGARIEQRVPREQGGLGDWQSFDGDWEKMPGYYEYRLASIFPPRVMYSARNQLINIWLDFHNNYLTPGKYADHHHITPEHARALIDLARAVNDSPHPEA